MRARWPELLVGASLVLFVAVAGYLGARLPVWSELVSALPSHGYRTVVAPVLSEPPSPLLTPPSPDARLPFEPSCAEPDAPTLAVSSIRPHLSWCVGHDSFPVVVSPYTSGLAAWPLALLGPLHGFDLFGVRVLWLFIAALGLLLSFRVISRVADRETAALACFATAASSPFLVLNALLVPFETVPATLLVAAASVWTGANGPLRPARLCLAALLAGFAVATNLKALFLLVPLAVIAWRAGVRVELTRRVHLLFAALAFVMPLAPLLLFAWADPRHGLQGQFSLRAGWALSNLQWSRFVTEPALLFNFASDFTSYFDMAERREALAFSWVHAVVAIPLGWCLVSGVGRLFGRAWGSLLSSVCGGVLLTFFFVSVLLYKQYPGGNYAPLHDLMGVATAAGFVDLARLVAKRRPLVLAALGVSVMAGGGLWHVLRRGDPAAHVATSFNGRAVRDAAEFLGQEPEVPVLTTTYNLSGVFDSVGAGRVRGVSVHQVFDGCMRFRDAELATCVRERWRWLLGHGASLPLRVVLPASVAPVDKPLEVTQQLAERLHQAAGELGLTVRDEASFATSGGTKVLQVLRIEGHPLSPWGEGRGEGKPTEGAPDAGAPGCAVAISADLTKRLFDLINVPPPGGCTLLGVTSSGDRITVRWTGAEVTLWPMGCAPPNAFAGRQLAWVVDSAATACPSDLEHLRRVLTTEDLGALVPAR